jgi:hypothetical protein
MIYGEVVTVGQYLIVPGHEHQRSSRASRVRQLPMEALHVLLERKRALRSTPDASSSELQSTSAALARTSPDLESLRAGFVADSAAGASGSLVVESQLDPARRPFNLNH